ncbi:hypothetical protein COCON_G00058540 [Conger conger]|uniref:Uncharacterized protein n=1 Tax=Conger conger TaxID=82655 RepID=A0A9Q1DQT9_CONCO|nr:hypothetical protein COCON_G00058540 [Conger conger]
MNTGPGFAQVTAAPAPVPHQRAPFRHGNPARNICIPGSSGSLLQLCTGFPEAPSPLRTHTSPGLFLLLLLLLLLPSSLSLPCRYSGVPDSRSRNASPSPRPVGERS